MSKSKFLVTGGAGFIGCHIVEELLKQGQFVRVLDNFSTGKRENLKEFNKDIELIEGDIRSYHIVREAVKDIEFILHQAALPSVPRSIKDPITTNEVNVVGTLNILNAARHAKVRRIVYASSSSVYGDLESLPKTEDMLPKPLSPYAVSKLASEKYCQVFTKLYGLETIIFRYFNVFGPRQDPASQYSAVIPKFIHLIKSNESPVIYGDGMQSRDFTYVKNIVEANLLACYNDIEGFSGEIFNIATGKRATLINLVDRINKILNKEIQCKFAEVRSGDVKHSLANIGKAHQFINYFPSVNFEEGLRFTIEFFQKQAH